MVIRAGDRLSAVIAQDDSVVDMIASLTPAFERLRNPRMRKVMSRLVTVEQVARMAGVEPADLVRQLNAHVSGELVADSALHTQAVSATDDRPAILSTIPEQAVLHLDVRDELRAGREPFSTIMTTMRLVSPGGALTVRAIFEPVPLYSVMKRHGFSHWTEQLGDDDWRVWFYRDNSDTAAADTTDAASAETSTACADQTSAAASDASAAAHASESGDDDVVIIDVRGLEPPEPMVRTLEALATLPVGATLLQINVRVPQFLLPQLEQRGFAYEVREQGPDLVRVFIRHRN